MDIDAFRILKNHVLYFFKTIYSDNFVFHTSLMSASSCDSVLRLAKVSENMYAILHCSKLVKCKNDV